MTKTSALAAAATPDGTELLPVVQGGANKKLTVTQVSNLVLGLVRNGVDAAHDTLSELYTYASGIATSLAAHVGETDPIAHTAGKIAYSGTVSAGDVGAALDALDSAKVSASAIPELTRMLSASPSTVNKNTTILEETLISFVVVSNTMDANGDMLVVEASGDILANNGAPTFAWKLKSGTVVVDTPADALTVSASLRRWKLRVVITRTTVGSQVISFQLQISQPGTQAAQTADKTYVGNFTDFSATNFAADITVAFTVQMSVSNSNDRVRMYGYNAYKVPA